MTFSDRMLTNEVTSSFNMIQLYVNDMVVSMQVPCARTSLNHDDIFILDTESKIYQFNGSNSSIQERAKALEVVQYIKDNNHHGKCDIAAIGESTFSNG